MAKFAALSNRPTSNCQRRKEKRFKIPKVTVIKKSYHEKTTNGIYKSLLQIFSLNLLKRQSFMKSCTVISHFDCMTNFANSKTWDETCKNRVRDIIRTSSFWNIKANIYLSNQASVWIQETNFYTLIFKNLYVNNCL